MTPSEYAQFRHVLGPASGLQSYQYRAIEFILGNKQKEMLDLFAHDEMTQHAVPRACLEREWAKPYRRNPDLIPVFQRIYATPEAHWMSYALCEKLVDIDEHFQLWRFRHVKTVERIIGYKRGTGGSSGVAFLKKVVDLAFFPELLDVRTEIESPR